MSNFRGVDRDQAFLLPPDMRDWLGQDDLAWTLIDAVGQMDLSPFVNAYRRDGRGAAAFDPRMMVTLLLYSYAMGERSSRRIEQACDRDVAYRVVSANQKPDHSTIARFRQRFGYLLEVIFAESVRLCMQAGLGRVGTVAIDGRKVACDASLGANRTSDGIDEQIRRWLAEAEQVDANEDALFGADKRGDELPPELRDPSKRLARLTEAKAQLDAQKDAARQAHRDKLDARKQHRAEHGANPSGKCPSPPDEKKLARWKANITDPQSRPLKSRRGYVQGYNGQVTVTQDHIVIGVDVVQDHDDRQQLLPMINRAKDTLEQIGSGEQIDRVLADAGYGTEDDFEQADQDTSIPRLYVPITSGNHDRENRIQAPVAGPGTYRGRMLEKMRQPWARVIYTPRCHIVETIFGNQETALRFNRFSRRGLAAARSEWHLINAIHNLKKLHTSNQPSVTTA